MHVAASAVQGLEAVHDELLLQLNHHVLLEDDPQRLILDDAIAQCAGGRIHHVVVAVVGNHIDPTVLPSHGIPPESDCTVSQALSVGRPVGVASPAVVDRVASSAPSQHSPREVAAQRHHTVQTVTIKSRARTTLPQAGIQAMEST